MPVRRRSVCCGNVAIPDVDVDKSVTGRAAPTVGLRCRRDVDRLGRWQAYTSIWPALMGPYPIGTAKSCSAAACLPRQFQPLCHGASGTMQSRSLELSRQSRLCLGRCARFVPRANPTLDRRHLRLASSGHGCWVLRIGEEKIKVVAALWDEHRLD